MGDTRGQTGISTALRVARAPAALPMSVERRGEGTRRQPRVWGEMRQKDGCGHLKARSRWGRGVLIRKKQEIPLHFLVFCTLNLLPIGEHNFFMVTYRRKKKTRKKAIPHLPYIPFTFTFTYLFTLLTVTACASVLMKLPRKQFLKKYTSPR